MAWVDHRFKGVWTLDTSLTESQLRALVESVIPQVLSAAKTIIKSPAYKQRTFGYKIIIAQGVLKQIYPKVWYGANTDLDRVQQLADVDAILTLAAGIADVALADAGIAVIERELKYQS